jgi:uncharacterized protein (UPF0276 family)
MEDLDLLARLIEEEPDYYEVAPETLWRADALGRIEPNEFHRRFEELRARTGRPFVAHGVMYSVGTADPGDEPRRARWLEAIAKSHSAFQFEWYTDHLGATTLDGRALMLPMPVPLVDDMADLVRARLSRLQEVVPEVGLENSVVYHVLGDPLDEPPFLARALDGPGMHLLLDVHNLWTMALDHGFDAQAWLARAPLERVIEIHVSGGSTSDVGWLPEGRTMRLDSHDHGVPEEVWALLEGVVPRCPNLRGVTLERMETTIGPDDVAVLRAELSRAREICG